MIAMVNHDFNHALEEGLDAWLRRNPNGSWEELIKGVELLELATADRMRQALNIKG